MRPDARCVIDWGRAHACGACIAPTCAECPYAYLLNADEGAAVVRAARVDRDVALGRSDRPTSRDRPR